MLHYCASITTVNYALFWLRRLTNKGIKALAEFISKTGAFSRSGTPSAPQNPPTIKNEPIPDINQIINPVLVDDDGG
jgi:hypothetical protein